MTTTLQTSYLRRAFDLTWRKNMIAKAVKDLTPIIHRFDAIAVRGASGMLFGPAIADAVGKPFVLVRKKEDKRHSYYDLEGEIGHNRFLVVDDLVDSGNTVAQIIIRLREESADAQCVGVWTYNGGLFPRFLVSKVLRHRLGYQSHQSSQTWPILQR